ncbi:MAG: DUF4364 family protein [Oscillospiraceae bacterium]|nr:DUF4364 family protein [Oscillospiraceae bacterium]
MPSFGFIKDKLEIKFLILYIMARLVEPVPFETLQELSMCDSGVDYFGFSECLADLVRTEHLRMADGLYAITDKGRRNSSVCESSLPYSVRIAAERKLVLCNEQLKRRALVRAAVQPREKGGYEVSLSLSDELDELMSLKLLVTRQDMALELQKRFREGAEELYAKILADLYGKTT